MTREINDKLVRCPRLGDEMSFSYCLRESGALPCSRIISCWSVAFDVESFLHKNMSDQDWQNFDNAQPKDKVTSLIEIIEAAKRKNEDSRFI
jgi:hypothetical protein